jgi:hypothetical protein
MCYTSDSQTQVLLEVRDVELASLDLIKLSVSKTPQPEDLDVWITCPGIKTRNGQYMSDAERVLDALNAASSLAALERCYTLFLFLLTHQ